MFGSAYETDIQYNQSDKPSVAPSNYGAGNYGVNDQDSGHLGHLASVLGCPEAALRLFISILLGFPLAFVHRNFFYGNNPRHSHFFFLVCGLCLAAYNYGPNVIHSAVALIVSWLILALCKAQFHKTPVLLVFLFNMIYLTWGYYTTATGDYDIKWTMPQCVLTLRLIGLAFDIHDGKQNAHELSENQKKTALKRLPSLLETAGFVYFPGSFLVGPQFNMRRYLDYVNCSLVKTETLVNGRKKPPNSTWPGMQRAVLGFVYVALYQLGTHYVTDDYLLDESFKDIGFFQRCFFIGLWGRCNLYKYISVWLISEGVCIVFGITYNGKDAFGNEKWDGCANVDIITFENATEFNHYILSFNINTNLWCAEYIYKRCKFLKSRFASQFITLLFLSIWHGLHSGYYVCFFMEFIIMYFEKDIKPAMKNSELAKFKNQNIVGKPLCWILLKIYTFVFMGYSLIPFVLLSYDRYMQVFSSVYYIGHVVFLTYLFVSPLLKGAARERLSASDRRSD